MNRWSKSYLQSGYGGSVVAALAVLVLLVGCEESIPAFELGEEAAFYSMYGYLLTGVDTSFIRVVRARETLERTDSRIDATVVSEDLMTGEKITWQDSLVRIDDGSFNQVYWTDDVPVKPNHHYRIELQRSDGEITSALVKVPAPPASVKVGHVFDYEGYKQRVTWQTSAPSTFVANVTYVVETVKPGSGVLNITFPYADSLQRTSEGWRIEVELEHNRAAIKRVVRDAIIFTSETDVILHEIRLYLVVPHEQWDPPVGYGSALLAQPGLFSNVENGDGFVGGAADTTVHWQLNPIAARRLDFTLP